MDRDSARQRAWMLYRDLQRATDRDPDQEVTGIAVPAVDALLQECRRFVPDDPVVRSVDGLVTPESVGSGALRAVEAMIVVGQLAFALGPEKPPPGPPMVEPPSGPHWSEQGF